MSQPEKRRPSLTSPATSQHSTASAEGEAVRVGALEKAVGGDALSARVALVVVPEDLHLAQLAARQRSLKGGLPVAAGARDVVQ